jgi:hypothetical protein
LLETRGRNVKDKRHRKAPEIIFRQAPAGAGTPQNHDWGGVDPVGALWARLRGKNLLGIKFRRQQIIEGFIADFYCEAAKLAIEIDGGIHSTQEQKALDEHRRKVFEARGLRELRFSNTQI